MVASRLEAFMLGRSRSLRVRVGLTAIAALAVVLSSPPHLAGQPAAAPSEIMPAARAAAFADAAAQGLDYLPGEVVVKFKDGMTPERQQRALDALRSRPST